VLAFDTQVHGYILMAVKPQPIPVAVIVPSPGKLNRRQRTAVIA